jgi:hypothetical protein
MCCPRLPYIHIFSIVFQCDDQNAYMGMLDSKYKLNLGINAILKVRGLKVSLHIIDKIMNKLIYEIIEMAF